MNELNTANREVATLERAPTRYVEGSGIRFAYRKLGPSTGTPVVLLQHFSGNIDAWDPALVNVLAVDRPVIVFDDAGVGRSTGQTPDNVAALARDAVTFIELQPRQKRDTWRPCFPVLRNPWGSLLSYRRRSDRHLCASPDVELIDRADRAAIDPQHRAAEIVGEGTCEMGDRSGDLLRSSKTSDIIGNHIPHAAALDLFPGASPSEARRYVEQKLFD